MMAENMKLLGHRNSRSQSISIFLNLFLDMQFLQSDPRSQVMEPKYFLLGTFS